MFKIKKRRHKPLYKKFISLRANIQYRRRLMLLKFKKQKWQRLNAYLQRLQNRRKKKFRLYDLRKHYLPKFYNPFKQKYKSKLLNKKKISLFYGNFLEKYLKKQVNLVVENKKKILKNQTNLNSFFLSLIEKRLDVVLYRSHFVLSIRNAQQLIIHRHIKVNGVLTTNPSYNLKQGDIIEVNKKMQSLVYSTIISSHIWPLPPKYLQINYKTFEILFNGNIEFQNMSTQFSFWPDIYMLLRYYR
jgi:small subunit ribosomal protein S4